MNANVDLKLTLPEAVDAVREVLPRVLSGMDTSNPEEAGHFLLDELQFCIDLLRKAQGIQDEHV